MDLHLDGKVALVTAASKGLGKAAALALAREGARVMVSARSDLVHETARNIQSETGAQVASLIADVTHQADIDKLVQATLDKFGVIDILFVNAGGPKPGDFVSLTPADWEEAVNLTLMSAVRLCYAVVPHMLARREGVILSTQSFTVKQPLDNLILSNSIRMAVIGLMKCLANELGPHGIRVNTINPSWTRTERVDQLMQNRAATNGTTPEQERAAATAAIPLRRMGTVEEFGNAVAWLASPAASFINGHALLFDGGITKASL